MVVDQVIEFADIFSKEEKAVVGSTGLIEFEVQLRCYADTTKNETPKSTSKNILTKTDGHVGKREKLYKRVIRLGRVGWLQLRNQEEIRGIFDG